MKQFLNFTLPPYRGVHHGATGIRLGTRHLRNGRYGIFGQDRADHSGLMLANFTTLAHFSMSSAMNLPNSADELANAV